MAAPVIKLLHGKDWRRFRHEGDFAALRARIEATHESLKGAKWRLLWADEDGDWITIATTEDLALAHECTSASALKMCTVVDQEANTVNHPCHRCPLKLSTLQTPWICDGQDRCGGCRSGGDGHGPVRYRCTLGCDFDLCGACIEDTRGDMRHFGPRPRARMLHTLNDLARHLGQRNISMEVDVQPGRPWPRGERGGRGGRGGGGGHGPCGRRHRHRRGCEPEPEAPRREPEPAAPATEAPAAEAPAATPVSTPEVEGSGFVFVPQPQAEAAQTPSAPSAPAAEPAPAPAAEPAPAPAAEPGPWAAHRQILMDMGFVDEPAGVLEAALARHNGRIADVLSDMFARQ